MNRPPVNPLVTQTKLIRRGVIRRILAGRGYSAATGITSYEELQEELAKAGHPVSVPTVRNDMEALQAVKIKIEGEGRSFWFIPPWNPEMAYLRDAVDQETVEQEVAARVAAYVSGGFHWQCEAILNTEQHCGPMLADWVTKLQWPGMLHVREFAHSISILCESEEVAEYVLNRLIGVGE